MPIISIPAILLAGTYADKVFYWCVDVLNRCSAQTGMTYEELNVLLFCVIEPIIFIIIIITIARLRKRNRKLQMIIRNGLAKPGSMTFTKTKLVRLDRKKPD